MTILKNIFTCKTLPKTFPITTGLLKTISQKKHNYITPMNVKKRIKLSSLLTLQIVTLTFKIWTQRFKTELRTLISNPMPKKLSKPIT